jgi:transposase-like protein
MMSAEISLFLGREKYERQTLVAVKSRNYRNGWYNRSFCVKGIGQIEMRVPRDRRGSFQTSIIPKYERIDDRIKEDCLLLYLTGLSTRTLEMLSTRLFGRKISKSEISELSKELAPKIEQWRNRELTDVFKYLYIDGTNFNMRIDGTITKVCVLVVIGVNEQNQKQVLALQAGDKESSSTWRQLFKDLKKRGLQGGKVQLGLMDGLPGLEKVFTEEFVNAEVQKPKLKPVTLFQMMQ